MSLELFKHNHTMDHAKSIGIFGLNLVGMIAIFSYIFLLFWLQTKMPRKENRSFGYSLLLSERGREGL